MWFVQKVVIFMECLLTPIDPNLVSHKRLRAVSERVCVCAAWFTPKPKTDN
jgi:hypothetical protein